MRGSTQKRGFLIQREVPEGGVPSRNADDDDDKDDAIVPKEDGKKGAET